MRPNTIVYTSNTGHTAEYARLLSERTGLPLWSLDEAVKQLKGGAPILYLGWLRMNKVSGYREAAKRFSICAVCGVGLCDTGSMLDEARKAISLPKEIPLFTLQGGMDRSKLKGFDQVAITMLAKGLAAQKQRSAQDERILELLESGTDGVREENLAQVLSWYEQMT